MKTSYMYPPDKKSQWNHRLLHATSSNTLHCTCSVVFPPSLYPVVLLQAGQWQALPRPFIIRGGGSNAGGIPWRSLHISRWGLKFGTEFVHWALPAVFWVGAAEAWLQTFVCEVTDLKGGSIGTGEFKGDDDGALQWPHWQLNHESKNRVTMKG